MHRFAHGTYEGDDPAKSRRLGDRIVDVRSYSLWVEPHSIHLLVECQECVAYCVGDRRTRSFVCFDAERRMIRITSANSPIPRTASTPRS
jgi:hypothetical protein